MRPIAEIVDDMGLPQDAIEPYGRYKAKVPLNAFPDRPGEGMLVVVTGMTPTPAGEGKTTTAIGLVQALGLQGKHPVLALRQPSIGPVFGVKGGGTGGGKARIMPDTEINLHFTGDAHAVASAHNLLAAMVEAAVFHGTAGDLEPSGQEWRRVTNIGDRAMRQVVTGLGGRANGSARETGFDIDAASEIMAVAALSTSYEDLRARLGRLVVGNTKAGEPVTAADLNAVGAMMALLKDVLKPNVVQTLEGQPTLVHCGPFGNIAHGCSSILSDQLAVRCGDIVVTEAGFGADLGLEKFIHIKTRSGGVHPRAAVLVVTIRALKWHGGAGARELTVPNMEALRKGFPNMEHHIGLIRMFGLPAVVAVNHFPDDPVDEVEAVKEAAMAGGAYGAAASYSYSQGGEGVTELAELVASACTQPSGVKYVYPLDAPIEEKVEALARNVYNAGEVQWDRSALRQARRYADQGWGNLPICMAKTHLSISADPRLLCRPQGHTLPIVGLRLAAGAGFLYPLAGDIMTMPGLPTKPAAFRIDVDSDGNITGLT